MKFCSACGQPVTQRIPEGDSRLRYVCESCQTIHYQNPNIVAGVLPTGAAVLLCRRAIEPRRGFWTLPAGFMENGETLDQAARRETVEEACARVGSMSLYQLFDLPHINQCTCSSAPSWQTLISRSVSKAWKCGCSKNMRFRGASWLSAPSLAH